MTYEYAIIYLVGDPASDRDELNALGAEGFKIVSMQNGWTYLMREKPGQKPKTTRKRKVTVKAEGDVKPKAGSK